MIHPRGVSTEASLLWLFVVVLVAACCTEAARTRRFRRDAALFHGHSMEDWFHLGCWFLLVTSLLFAASLYLFATQSLPRW